jgi:riboflavin biosynthesis pyrimidine reductase
VGRVLFEGGGQLSRALLAQGLVDEFHRFSADAPAGGEPVHLDLATLPRTRAQAAFSGGHWEVLARA